MPRRLKSLELHGYKTFANRTQFEFAERITVVVGPNGSGKSNIADSIRWVLGEQSYSLLRGKKTEDMIFSGSESRPRLGMASATIVFDNSDGWLPIDFGEVAITRRAYRDGENEYLINGQRVRLKDVTELLAQSGLAERTYTVIGQGLVDAALSLKAEERRRLFEEAAGIGLHRSRREEALKRLENTRRNLERVEDILFELQPRLSSLERQARKAREVEQVQADLRLHLRDWYGYHWHHAQRDLAAAQEATRQQESRLEQARQEQERLNKAVLALRQQIQARRAELMEISRALAELHNQRQTISRDLAVVEERLRSLREQLLQGQAEQRRLAEELTLAEERLQQTAAEESGLTAELAEAQQQAAAARQALQEHLQRQRQAEQSRQRLREQLGAVNARRGQLQARLVEREQQAVRMERLLQEAMQALQQAEEAGRLARERQEAMRLELRLAEEEHQRRQAAMSELRAQRQKLEQQREQAAQELATAQTQRSQLQAQLKVIDQAETSLSGYSGGARLLLQAARQKRLPGGLGALSSFLEAPPELEAALAAALGEFLEALVLEQDPDAALELLEKEGAGRGILLPVGLMRTEAAVKGVLKASDEVVGIAAELVQCPEELRPVVQALLGQVIIVRDRGAARRLQAQQPAGVRLVTLAGEVFHATGAIQAGRRSTRGEEASLLTRTRQRRETAAQLEQVEQLVQERQRRHQELEAEARDLLVSEQRALKELEVAAEHLTAKRTALEQARLAAEQAEEQRRFRQEQQQNLQQEISQAAEQTHRLMTEQQETELELQRLREAEVALREQQRAALAQGPTLDELQIQAAHWETRLAVAQRALQELERRRLERRTVQEQLQQAQSALVQRLAGLSSRQQELEGEKTRLRQEEEALVEKIQQLESQVQPEESALKDLERTLLEQEGAESAARQMLNSAEHLFAQARITLARRQEELEALKRRIEEDFGLVAFTYAAEVSGPTPLPLEGMVEQLPSLQQIPPELEETIKRLRAQLRRMGPINPEALEEYEEVRQRCEFLKTQVADLHRAEADVLQVIAELDTLMQREFRKTFQAVAAEFRQIFTRLFGGGSARLELTDPDDLNASGIEIEARLPGRRAQGLSLLSGGERSLAAAALVFALLKVSPTPFCVLDEVDAMLDEANVGRFVELLRELAESTQFLLITHNRNTVQAADIIYGVTMGRDSASQVLSLRLGPDTADQEQLDAFVESSQ